jgi:hypothetical protein
MTADVAIRLVMGFILAWLLWRMVLRPWIVSWAYKRRVNNHIEKEFIKKIFEPNLNVWEMEKLAYIESIPTDDEIMKYYKMYCKKWQIDNADEWTTYTPMDYEEFEKKCKTPTKIVKPKEDEGFGFMVAGGYLYMIGKTCDAFMGFPPNQVLMRYKDYARMVEEEDEQLMETTENV